VYVVPEFVIVKGFVVVMLVLSSKLNVILLSFSRVVVIIFLEFIPSFPVVPVFPISPLSPLLPFKPLVPVAPVSPISPLSPFDGIRRLYISRLRPRESNPVRLTLST